MRNNKLTTVSQQTALALKMVPASNAQVRSDADGDLVTTTPNKSFLQSASTAISERNNELESIYRLMPDIELGVTSFISSVLSPKDLSSPQLSYRLPSPTKYGDMGSAMLGVVRSFFNDDYKINKRLYQIYDEAKFKKGASITMTIPETSVDRLINGNATMTLESVSEATKSVNGKLPGIGLLQNIDEDENVATLEAIFVDEAEHVAGVTLDYANATIIDNPDAVKMSLVRSKLAEQRSSDAVNHYTQESASTRRRKSDKRMASLKGKSATDVTKSLVNARGRDKPEHEVDIVRTELGKSVGHPLEMDIPIESCIPVFVGKNDKHIGYHILLDSSGYPINTSGQVVDAFTQIRRSVNSKMDGNNESINGIMTELTGGQQTINSSMTGQQVSKMLVDSFSSRLEKDIYRAIRLDAPEEIRLGARNEIYQVMLARKLSGKQTQVLYVPAEFISYIAFEHDASGVGVSILDAIKYLASMRAMLYVSSVRAQIKNSTPTTTYDVTLDENDPNPRKTIAMVRDALIQSRADDFPLGDINLSSISEAIRNASISIKYKGHPGLPDMDVDASEGSSSMASADTELADNLRDQIFSKIGLNPESAILGRGYHLATSEASSSLMMARRVMSDQVAFEPQITDRLRKYTRFSEPLNAKLLAIAEKNMKEFTPDAVTSDLTTDGEYAPQDVVDEFVDEFYAELPRPDSVTLDAQMSSYKIYEDAIDDLIENYIDEDMIAEGVDDAEVDDLVRELKTSCRAYLLRQFQNTNNIVSELSDLFESDVDGDSKFNLGNIASDHNASITGFIEKWVKRRDKIKAKAAADAAKEAEASATPPQDGEGEPLADDGDGLDEDLTSDEPDGLLDSEL